MNTTDSAVRITHKPTGMVVAMQDEKSQIQNRAKALQVLRARLLKLEQDRQAAELSDARRGQIGGGGRSEKIRTYNFKENRVTDHRIGLTIYKLDKVLAGELDEVVDALVADERSRQLQRPGRRLIRGRSTEAGRRHRLVGRAAGRGRSDGWTRPVCSAPAVDARRLVEQASGSTGAELALAPRRAGHRRAASRTSTRMLARRLAGEPLQYVLGRVGVPHARPAWSTDGC